MNRAHKFSASVAIVLGGTVLAACSSGTSSSETSSAAATQAATTNASSAASAAAPPAAGDLSMTYLAGVAGDAFYISVGCAAKAEADSLGVALDIQAPAKWDVTLQRPIVDAAIAANPSAMIVTPNDEAALQQSLNQAKEAGITLVLSDTTTKDPSVAVSAVTGDNVKIGALAFEAIKAAHPDGGKLLIMGSAPGITTGDDRIKGFTGAAAADSKFQIVSTQYGQDDNAKAAQLMSAALQKDPDIIGVFGVSGTETQGAATALRQEGKNGTITLVGVDAYPAQVEAMKSGDVQALIAQDVAELGKQSVLQAYNALTGQTVEPSVLVGSTVITPDNLDLPEGQAALYKSDC
jgi:ribose transport system substrate-binding protein